MSEATLARRVASFAAAGRGGGVGSDIAHSVRQRMLDILGITVAASALDTSAAVRGYALAEGGRPESSVIGSATRLPAPLAALVNGTLAHSLDYDDTHLPSVLHPSASVVPAALAVGEAARRPGGELLAAIAVGLEVCVRLGMAGYEPGTGANVYFDKGQHATSICGAIGSAVAAAMLLGLDEAGIVDALAISASMASGVIEANRTGGTVKRVHCGWAAHAGVTAARLAQHGITGPPTVLEGRFGFFQAFLDGRFDPGSLLDGLGERWEVPGIFFKPYPANHFTHAGIDAALQLRGEGIRAEDVAALTLGVATSTVRTIGEPVEIKRAPATGYQAQFSGPYTVVAALMGGGGLGLGLDDFTDALAGDPARREHMSKVTVVADADCDAIFPRQFPAVLTARLQDGTELTRRVMSNRGGPGRPLSDDELARKFTDNAARRLSDEALERVRTSVLSLDDASDLTTLLLPMTKLQED